MVVRIICGDIGGFTFLRIGDPVIVPDIPSPHVDETVELWDLSPMLYADYQYQVRYKGKPYLDTIAGGYSFDRVTGNLFNSDGSITDTHLLRKTLTEPLTKLNNHIMQVANLHYADMLARTGSMLENVNNKFDAVSSTFYSLYQQGYIPKTAYDFIMKQKDKYNQDHAINKPKYDGSIGVGFDMYLHNPMFRNVLRMNNQILEVVGQHILLLISLSDTVVQIESTPDLAKQMYDMLPESEKPTSVLLGEYCYQTVVAHQELYKTIEQLEKEFELFASQHKGNFDSNLDIIGKRFDDIKNTPAKTTKAIDLPVDHVANIKELVKKVQKIKDRGLIWNK